ncbi:MarR family winged helix-turn-helix transcriptional regulator [Sporomusa acidovorans]|uniref:HTH marR-type domain-containing protein n=1 Tax=Sporomusa acidovorans (strain ATCC 49682 / DSM 3132 / Mol) TaxID=1123286 RepID=A0ABZ3IZ26_SPOA4|nr:MarR family transcriptional regulator [Sporomusa acidovorans]OZC18294.1 MarR family protein [Sporomusa acidovorans DSM 3132]SDF20794.1 DNA-binding transcriptional regulator, MarR family [Sporomusa acidovorans]
MTALKNQVLREVGALARCIQSISDIQYRNYNLQRGQFIFLTRICEHPGINLIELSHILKVDKATTTKAVQKLMQENYIVRERDRADKRMWHLFPSTKAKEVYPCIIEEENRYIEICFQGFTQKEKDHVGRLLKKMRENIEQEWKALKSYKEESR